MRPNKWFVLRCGEMAAILTLVALLLAGCSLLKVSAPKQANTAQEQQVRTVKVEEIAKQKIGDPIELVEDIVSSVQVSVNAKADGEVEAILKKRGDPVKQGQIILRLSSKDLKLQRDKAALALKNAQNARNAVHKDSRDSLAKMIRNVADAVANYNQLRNEYDLGSASKAELELAQTQVNNAETDLELLKQQQNTNIAAGETEINNARLMLQEADQALSNLEVKAPISGVLTDMPMAVGTTIRNGVQIGLIEKLDLLTIKVNLMEDKLKFIRGKRELTYYLPENPQTFKGKISYVSSVADPQTHTYELSMEVPNANLALQPGMKVKVQLTDENDQNVVSIPTQSILQEGEYFYVFIVANGIVEKRKVELGRLNEPIQEVLSGVKEGEILVISGQNQLKDNEQVQPVPVKVQK